MAERRTASLSVGYDEEFVSPVDDDLTCLICHLPLREPVLTRCGHRFCRYCLTQCFTRQNAQCQSCPCPIDREELVYEKDIFPDKATERKILSLAIKCPSEGCDWTGELRDKQNHLSSCHYKVVYCTNQNCEEILLKKDVDEHVASLCQWRIVHCVHCNEPRPECQEEQHLRECKKYQVECPDGCGVVMQREKLSRHTGEECPLTIIPCPYYQMGCDVKIPRKEVESHLQTTMRLHLDLTSKFFKETTSKLEEKVNKLQLKQVELDQERTTLKMQMQELTTANASLNAKIIAQGKHVTELKDEFSKYVWKMTGFSAILKDAKDGVKKEIYSSPFETGKQGYKLSICVQPDGDLTKKNRYLSVFLGVMKGNFDAILPWPFRSDVKFTLIDQQDDPDKRINVSESFAVSPPFERPRSGAVFSMFRSKRFISHKNLKTRRYIVDDTLFLQVEVRPCD